MRLKISPSNSFGRESARLGKNNPEPLDYSLSRILVVACNGSSREKEGSWKWRALQNDSHNVSGRVGVEPVDGVAVAVVLIPFSTASALCVGRNSTLRELGWLIVRMIS